MKLFAIGTGWALGAIPLAIVAGASGRATAVAKHDFPAMVEAAKW